MHAHSCNVGIAKTTNPEENLFCEGCGTRVGGSTPAESAETCVCGAPLSEIDEDGFCGGCGRRLKRPPEDHIEIELLPDFAGVSDRGLRHSRNEDRFAIAQSGKSYALIVCDGVSMSPDADQASSIAVQAALEHSTKDLRNPNSNLALLLRTAIASAVRSVTELGKRVPNRPLPRSWRPLSVITG